LSRRGASTVTEIDPRSPRPAPIRRHFRPRKNRAAGWLRPRASFPRRSATTAQFLTVTTRSRMSN